MPKNIDLLVIKPGNPQKIYGDLSQTLSAIEPPVMGGLIAGFIREKGYSVKILNIKPIKNFFEFLAQWFGWYLIIEAEK